MSRTSRWAGVSPTDRRAERRVLLLDAAYALFGDGGEAAVSVRSVCRASELDTRYFYENFAMADRNPRYRPGCRRGPRRTAVAAGFRRRPVTDGPQTRTSS